MSLIFVHKDKTILVLLPILRVFLRPQNEPKKFIQHYEIFPEATHKVFALKIKVVKYVCIMKMIIKLMHIGVINSRQGLS